MIKKSVALLAALLCSAVLVGSAISPASAAGTLQFRKIYFNSPGSDTGSNTSLNAEYVTVKNIGTTTRSLDGWSIKDKAGYVYMFPTGSTLRPGYSVKVHTGTGTDTSANRYWNRSWYVWNNTGDTATLRSPSLSTADTCSWSGSGSYKTC